MSTLRESSMKRVGEIVKLSEPSNQQRKSQTPFLPTERKLESVTEYQDVEKLLQSHIPTTVARALNATLSSNYEVIRYDITEEIPQEDLYQAISILNESLLPCPKEVAMKAMHALKVRTASTPAEREIAEERIGVYLADLIAYPQDVVVSACRGIANHSKWFPAWADLRHELEWRVRKRRKALEALNGI